MLKLNNVSKHYGEVQVLNDITFNVEKDSILGLAGASGSGKSTLLRCIQKLESIDSGNLICDGEPGFMFQDFQLFPHMTVLQNLIYAPLLKDKSKNHVAEAMVLLKNLGISDKASTYPIKLSGGQKQRVALARSLMMSPQFLLCDEPTSGLDIITTLDVVSLLLLVKKMGVTMIIASHNLDFLTQIADRVIILKNGKISLDTNPQVLTDPICYLQKYY